MNGLRRLGQLSRLQALQITTKSSTAPQLQSQPCSVRQFSCSDPEASAASSSGEEPPAAASIPSSQPEGGASVPAASRASGLSRKDYAALMKDLRRKWTQEQQAQQQQEAEAEALRAQGRAVAKVLAEKRKQRARDLRAQIRAKEAAIRSRVQKQQQEQAALWRGAVAQVYEQHRRKLETTLLEQSRHWVRPEQLQARIEEALEHPVALFSEVIPEEPPAPDEDVSLRTREPYVRDYRRGPMFRYSPINRQ